jgi:hypothetical protein
MTNWEKKIIDAFESHYFASVHATGTGDDRGVLRLRSFVFFPDFDTVSFDEKVSYLEAAESLERKGIIKLNWEKHGKGERLKTLICEKFEMLFKEAGKPFPETEAEKIRAMLGAKAEAVAKTIAEAAKEAAFNEKTAQAEKVIALLEFFSINFGPREIGHGLTQNTMEDFVRLLEFYSNTAQLENITTRALSILLYRDSKHLEYLLELCNPLLSRAEKKVSVPDFSFLERSYPETMIAGKIIIEYKGGKTPLVNSEGHILGIPLENAEEIEAITLVSKKDKTVLTIENKETFYALGNPQKHDASKELSRFDCFLYAGGYSNRAAAALVHILAASGFSFYHAGDLDPDGILILQHIHDIAEKPVTPLRMDAATFDKYLSWARTLSKPMLHQIKKIRDETRAIPQLAGLLRRIEETGMGVEQEIVDYR